MLSGYSWIQLACSTAWYILAHRYAKRFRLPVAQLYRDFCHLNRNLIEVPVFVTPVLKHMHYRLSVSLLLSDLPLNPHSGSIPGSMMIYPIILFYFKRHGTKRNVEKVPCRLSGEEHVTASSWRFSIFRSFKILAPETVRYAPPVVASCLCRRLRRLC